MFEIRASAVGAAATRVVPAGESGLLVEAEDDVRAFAQTGGHGLVGVLPRPLNLPARVLIAAVGTGDEGGWRAAGAAVARVADPGEALEVALPPDVPVTAVHGLAEGLWLGAYRYRDAPEPGRTAAITLLTDDPDRYGPSLDRARAVARATYLARDLTNTPSSVKNPAWFAGQVTDETAGRSGLTVTVREGDQLRDFGGLLAVGGGSATAPRLVELSWRPAGATRHVVLVGKGITFDTGGISIKTRDGMKLMKKDMGGAAAVVAATLGAADLGLGVRVTALAPLAENAVSGSAYRPGDVITHYDGTTSETHNSDAEGRLVLADALAYAVATLAPDVVIDLATLTGATSVALGPRIAALYTSDDELATALTSAGEAAGERMWRMPLAPEYADFLHSDIADRVSWSSRGVGSVAAALFLREFLGDRAGHWAHLDMSAPAWADASEGELTRGATGWGVRTLIRYLSALDRGQQPGA